MRGSILLPWAGLGGEYLCVNVSVMPVSQWATRTSPGPSPPARRNTTTSCQPGDWTSPSANHSTALNRLDQSQLWTGLVSLADRRVWPASALLSVWWSDFYSDKDQHNSCNTFTSRFLQPVWSAPADPALQYISPAEVIAETTLLLWLERERESSPLELMLV